MKNENDSFWDKVFGWLDPRAVRQRRLVGEQQEASNFTLMAMPISESQFMSMLAASLKEVHPLGRWENLTPSDSQFLHKMGIDTR